MGGYLLSDIMSKDVILTTPTTTRDELTTLFESHTGLPVVDKEGRLMGVVSRSDLNRKGVRLLKFAGLLRFDFVECRQRFDVHAADRCQADGACC